MSKEQTVEESAIDELKDCVGYCRYHNGQAKCKNCGLDDDLIDRAIKEAQETARREERERVINFIKDCGANNVCTLFLHHKDTTEYIPKHVLLGRLQEHLTNNN